MTNKVVHKTRNIFYAKRKTSRVKILKFFLFDIL